MEIKDIKTEYRMQEIHKMIQARAESGLTVNEWCQKNNFLEGSYYYWLRKIRNNTVVEMKPRNEIVQVPIMVEKNPERKTKPIKMKYKDMELEIPTGTETADIVEILRAVYSGGKTTLSGVLDPCIRRIRATFPEKLSQSSAQIE